MVRTTVSLPDELYERAKAVGLPFSKLLQDAIRAELQRLNTVERVLTDDQDRYVMPVARDGKVITGRITGRLVADSPTTRVYLTRPDRVLIYDVRAQTVSESSDPAEDLRGRLATDDYIDLLDALGVEAVIDL